MSCDRGRPEWPGLLAHSTTVESSCQNPTITRRESRRKSPERRGSKKSNSAARPGIALPVQRPRRLHCKSLVILARRIPRTQREAVRLQSGRPASRARGATASRAGSYPDIARGISCRPTASPRVEIRGCGAEHPRGPVTRAASACTGLLRVPLSPRRLRRAIRSRRCCERGAWQSGSG